MIDESKVIKSFGNEWIKFDQSKLNNKEIKKIFNDYFKIFPFNRINKKSVGFDMGCGSGRWAKLIAGRVKVLNCIEPSNAIIVAKKNLRRFNNINFINARMEKSGLTINSQDFGYCLGVLHHLKDHKKGLKSCISLLKKGSPFLAYIYYSLDNKNFFYKLIWRSSDIMRKLICKLPDFYKNLFTDFLSILIYFPLAKFCLFLSWFNIPTSKIPLHYYKNLSFYTMRTDSRDRFGTAIEHRLSRNQIKKIFKEVGFCRIKFSNSEPFWCVLGYKK